MIQVLQILWGKKALEIEGFYPKIRTTNHVLKLLFNWPAYLVEKCKKMLNKK